MIDRVGAIHLVQKSSKSELSSRFFGRSKFWGAKKVEFSNGRLPPEDDSVRPQTLGKRVSDDSQHFIFHQKQIEFLPNFEQPFTASTLAPIGMKICTAVYTPRMALIGLKLGQNAFQTIPNISFFDIEKRHW